MPAEPNVTIAPAPSAPRFSTATRSIRSRVLGRSRDHATQERAVLVLHDVTKEYPNGNLALAALRGQPSILAALDVVLHRTISQVYFGYAQPL